MDEKLYICPSKLKPTYKFQFDKIK